MIDTSSTTQIFNQSFETSAPVTFAVLWMEWDWILTSVGKKVTTVTDSDRQ